MKDPETKRMKQTEFEGNTKMIEFKYEGGNEVVCIPQDLFMDEHTRAYSSFIEGIVKTVDVLTTIEIGRQFGSLSTLRLMERFVKFVGTEVYDPNADVDSIPWEDVPIEDWISFILLANYMNMLGALQLGKKMLAMCFRMMDTEAIKKRFDVGNITEEELKSTQRKHSWMFNE